MNSLDYVVDKVLEVIRRDIRKNTSDSYDTGTVKRIDGNIAWVQYDENNPQLTPVVISGASCKKGDKVRIKNNNGTAFILGNDSNPPTDDTKAEHAQVTAEISGRTAEEAQTTASEAEQEATVASQTAEAADTKADTALEQVGASITTDTLHYLATDLDSGVTTSTPGWTTTIQSITEEDPYLWTYHTYHKASGQSVNTTPVITGVYGPQGEQGTTGSQGPKGDKGDKGDTGATGAQGPQGETGATGPQGPQGETGPQGEQGPQGIQGEQGIQGIQGPAGNDGNDGDDGVSVTAVQPQYYLSTSSSSATGGSWGNSLNYETGKYIWTRDQITYSNSTTGYSTAIYNEALTTACSTSEQALNVAEGIDEHFWYDNTGAHITKDTQEDYQADPTNAGGNALITSEGMAFRKGTEELASFSPTAAQIGADGATNMRVSPDGIGGVDSEDNMYFEAGYDASQQSQGSKKVAVPDVSFGSKNVTTSSPLTHSDVLSLNRIDSGSSIDINRYAFSFLIPSEYDPANTWSVYSTTNCSCAISVKTLPELTPVKVVMSPSRKTFTEGTSESYTATCVLQSLVTSGQRLTISLTCSYNSSTEKINMAFSVSVNTGTAKLWGAEYTTMMAKYRATVMPSYLRLADAFRVEQDGIPYHRNPSETWGSVFDLIYPVGSIYMSVNSTDPATLFGGSWTQLQNRFLLGAGTSYTAGATGGSAYLQAHTHSFTGSSHSHDAGSKQAFLRYNQGTISTGVQERSVASGASGNYKAPVVNNANVDWSYLDKTSAETVGGTVGAVNTSGLSTGNAGNMPPYLVVYMWKRTA